MVAVTLKDLEEYPVPAAEREELLGYISSDSDGDEEEAAKKLEAFEPLLQLEDRFPTTVVVIGVPVVTPERVNKLTAVLRLKFGEELIRRGGEEVESGFEVDIPMNSQGTLTSGCCFLTFASGHAAQHAARILNGYKIDMKHTFRAAMLDDFDAIISRDENYNPSINLRGFTREDLRWWLLDPRLREQYVLRHGTETEVFWVDPMEKETSSLCYDGHRERQDGKAIWTEFKVAWSPQGSFLTTFHRQGIALWGGPNFEKKVRMEHKDVRQILFSPKETYVLTWDGTPPTLRSEKAVKIWNVMTGELLRQFATPAASPRGVDFPHFLFSHDERFLAKVGDKEFCVYAMDPRDCGEGVDEDPSPVKLLRDEKGHHSALKYPVEKFEWSPADCIASVWIPGSEDAPGRLVLVDIPSRRELASKNVYNVKGAAMHWQGSGDFLCLRTVVVKKTGKKGRKEFTQLEIFRMREKDIPVDNLRLNDVALQLHWEEGAGKRFVLVVQEEGTANQNLRFFRVIDGDESNVESGKRDTIMTHSLEVPHYMNFFKWAPFGSNFLVAALGEGPLMFCQLNDQDRAEVLHQEEHFMCNEARWSDCGRYLVSSSVGPFVMSSTQGFRNENDMGYCIWTFQGRLLEKKKIKHLYQFLWRPHPPSLLSEKQIESVKKRIKEYSKRYENEDEKIRTEKREEFLRQRKERCDAFEKIMAELIAWRDQNPKAPEWAALQEEFDAMFEWEVEETITERELDVRQEVI